ncbi:MAG TPA: 3-hydroxyacyl-CoA dehydrogenase NAD-binding domain-containing protein [Nitrospiria bacterium]|nr:3-hydroxyacyl-CoA dehydrogenase NAD-binding domain-containing protein [Nitrospiria bacterium]
MYIYKAGVIGAGTMGAQIAQVISFAGLPVVLKDLSHESVDKGLATIRKIYQSRVDKGKMTATEMDQKLALVTGSTSYDDFKDVDLAIEAVFEDLGVKQRVFNELETALHESAILATNTSALSISAIGSVVKRPHKLVGMHFFNPAHVMKLVEVIPGLATSPETVDDTVAFAESLRKIPVRVQECAGFLVNRLLMPYLNEAAIALEEGAASMKEIDQALTAAGLPMGPFVLLDMIGIDVAQRVAGILYDAYGPRMTAAVIMDELVKRKRLGQKVGKGFYMEGEDPELPALLAEIRKRRGTKPRSPSAFTPERLLFPMINEAVICLQEGVATATDIDIAMVAGMGFPQEKGGPLHLADAIGIDVVAAELIRLSRELGPRFWPAPMLKRMVAANYLGVKTKKGFFTY